MSAGKNRRYDAAILFLLFPLNVITDDAMTELVLHDVARQIFHFNRTLAQITPNWKCAELYYLRRQEYTPNPHAPLRWTQADLLTALHGMRRTIAEHNGADRQAMI